MGFESLSSTDTNASTSAKPGFFSPYESAVEQVPQAIANLGDQLKANPGQTAERIALDVLPSAAIGAALTYCVPGGPAGWVIGAAMTIPLAIKGIGGLVKAHDEASKPGANVQQIGKQLADSAVSNGFDLGLTFAAGWGGAKAGESLAANNLTIGDYTLRTSDYAKTIQGKVMAGENQLLLGGKAAFNFLRPSNLSGLFSSDAGALSASSDAAGVAGARILGADAGGGAAGGTAGAADALTSSKPIHTSTPKSVLDNMSATRRPLAAAGTRLAQLSQTADDTASMQVYNGLIHAHTILSDGDAQPAAIYSEAQGKGYDFAITSEHDHILAREGVEPNDERAAAEKGTPIIGSDPQELATQRAAAQAASVSGKFFADGGEELGTIGKIPPKLDADGKQIPRGANHTGIYNEPAYVKSEETARNGSGGVVNSIRSLFGLAPEADPAPPPIRVLNIGDGRVDQIQQFLDANNDPNNPTFAILNHPRVAQDFSSSTPANLQGHDYGMSLYPSFDDWLSNWGDKYAKEIEIAKGGALSQTPPTGGVIPPQWYDINDAQIMWDKGYHGGVSAGPDIHYQARVGEPPLATSVVAQSLDKNGIYEAFNARRTAITSNFNQVTAYMTANDGQYMMGNILDGSVVPSAGLTPEVHIGGNIDPAANYTVNIWQDPQVGDGQLASVAQTKTLTGSDLSGMNNVVKFDPIQPKAGSQSLFYAEVQRTDALSPKYGDIVGTNARNPDGTPANVTVTPHGTFVKGTIEQIEMDGEPGHFESRDYASYPAPPELEAALNVPPETPYPERAITSPIFVDPPSGGTQSLFTRGMSGAGSHTIAGMFNGSTLNPTTATVAAPNNGGQQ